MVVKPTLFLHIGHPKTASTTLQEFLFKNWKTLEASGFSLPTSDLTVAGGEAIPPGNPLWSLEKLRETNDCSPIGDWVSAASQKSNRLILSSECLIQDGYPQLLSTISEQANIHLIYYVRRQDKLLLSAWRQWGLKRGLSLDEFLARRLKNRNPDFQQVVRNWTNNCDVQNIHVRFLDPRFLTGDTVISDFCSVIGLDESQIQTVAAQNVSVDARLALFLNEYSELFDSVHDEEIFNLLQDKENADEPLALNWTSDQVDQIIGVFEPMNQELLGSYHSTHKGSCVIDTASAPIGELPCKEEQQRYVSKRLNAASNKTHPKLATLASILSSGSGQ